MGACASSEAARRVDRSLPQPTDAGGTADQGAGPGLAARPPSLDPYPPLERMISRVDVIAALPDNSAAGPPSQFTADDLAQLTQPVPAQFESVTTLMRLMFQLPHATVVLFDTAQHARSERGDQSFWQWARERDAPKLMVVEDAAKDARFSGSLLATAKGNIQFFAAAPLTCNAYCYGVLIVLDFEPRNFSLDRYAMLSATAEITAREMARERVLQLQRQQLHTNARAPPTHLRTAIDRCHEGVMLLDLSRPGWSIEYVNPACVAAAAVSELLAAGSDQAAASGSMAIDFWELFVEVAEEGDTQSKASLNALWSGRAFTLKVRARNPRRRGGTCPVAGCAAGGQQAATAGDGSSSSSGSSSGSGGGSSGGAECSLEEQQGTTLSILFRPASSDAQQAGRVPNCARLALPRGQEGSAAGNSRMRSFEAAREVAARQGDQGPLYYFGVLQPHVTAPTAAQQATGQEQAGAAAAAQGANESTAQHAEGGALAPVRASVTAAMLLGGEAGRVRTSVAEPVTPMLAVTLTQHGSGDTGAAPPASIPAFYDQRPGVMREVQLGPLIGAGAMGRCYKGVWQGGRVAVKVIDCWAGEASSWSGPGEHFQHQHQQQQQQQQQAPAANTPEGGNDVKGARAAMVEALLARSLSHPHIITTFCHGSTPPRPDFCGNLHQQVWIVQQYCSRGSLHDAFKCGLLRTLDGGPDLHAILRVAQEIAGAMQYLHNHGIVHGDLAPGNVLLAESTKDSRRWECKVSDFGLAQIGDASNSHLPSSAVGTVSHMPPEMVTGGALTKSVDVWSFAILLLEAYASRAAWAGYTSFQTIAAVASGKLPFPIPADLPPPLVALLRGCLSANPAKRPTFSQILPVVQGMLSHLQPLNGAGCSVADSIDLREVAPRLPPPVAGRARQGQPAADDEKQQQQQQQGAAATCCSPVTPFTAEVVADPIAAARPGAAAVGHARAMEVMKRFRGSLDSRLGNSTLPSNSRVVRISSQEMRMSAPPTRASTFTVNVSQRHSSALSPFADAPSPFD